jgi:hypothetical protein
LPPTQEVCKNITTARVKMQFTLNRAHLFEATPSFRLHFSRTVTNSDVSDAAGQHGLHHPAVVVDVPVLECECTKYTHVPHPRSIETRSCREGGQVDFIVSVRGLVPWFAYELEIKWSLESDELRHTWNSVVTTDTDHYSFREPLLQREGRNHDFLFGMKAWNLYKKGNARFVIEVTVCDVHPGLTTEEALIGIRNMDSTAASVRLKCNDMESLAPPLPLPVYAQDVEERGYTATRRLSSQSATEHRSSYAATARMHTPSLHRAPPSAAIDTPPLPPHALHPPPHAHPSAAKHTPPPPPYAPPPPPPHAGHAEADAGHAEADADAPSGSCGGAVSGDGGTGCGWGDAEGGGRAQPRPGEALWFGELFAGRDARHFHRYICVLIPLYMCSPPR